MKIKSSICQEDKAILNVYTPNNRISKYVKQTLKGLKRQSHSYSWRRQHSSLSNQLLRLDRRSPSTQKNEHDQPSWPEWYSYGTLYTMAEMIRQKITKHTEERTWSAILTWMIFLWNTLPNSRIHLLFKRMWNIHHNRSHSMPQRDLSKRKKFKASCILWT